MLPFGARAGAPTGELTAREREVLLQVGERPQALRKLANTLAAQRAIGSLNPRLDGFDASCFDGIYITGDITPETIARMNAERVDGSEEGGVDVSRLALPNPQEA